MMAQVLNGDSTQKKTYFKINSRNVTHISFFFHCKNNRSTQSSVERLFRPTRSSSVRIIKPTRSSSVRIVKPICSSRVRIVNAKHFQCENRYTHSLTLPVCNYYLHSLAFAAGELLHLLFRFEVLLYLFTLPVTDLLQPITFFRLENRYFLFLFFFY